MGTVKAVLRPRRFLLFRDVDVTGLSGTGEVAHGVEFDDGVCVMRWTGKLRSTVVYRDILTLIAIHGHDGNTHVRWLDI